MSGLELICSDLYDICSRIKEVDERYQLYFNRRSKKFEVRIQGALQFVVPFEKLDARTIVYAKKTRIERRIALIKEIEENNMRLEQEANRKLIDNALASIY